jgi:hypothetical protein
VNAGGDEPMIDPRENREDYQRALAWVGEQITAAERQGLTLEYLGGWHTYKPNPKTLERAWRVLYSIPDAITYCSVRGFERFKALGRFW